MRYDASSGLLDYGARLYDPALARWISVDPLAEKAYDSSTYAYCMNSPLNLIDLDGRQSNLVDPEGKQMTWAMAIELGRLSRFVGQKEADRALVGNVFQFYHVNLLVHDSVYEEVQKLVANILGSNTGYDFRVSNELSTDSHYRGGVIRDPKTGLLTVIMPEVWDEALFVHELVHCGQYERGEIGFAGDKGLTMYWLYDMFDEEMAYKFQEAMGGAFPADWRTIYMRDYNLKYEDLRLDRDSDPNFLQIRANGYNQVFKFNGINYVPDHIKKAIRNN